MKKIILMLFITSYAVFGQSPKKYLTKEIIDHYIKNKNEIEKLLETVYVKNIPLESPMDFKEAFTEYFGDYNKYEKLKKSLMKYKIGKDPIDTAIILSYGQIILSLEKCINETEDALDKEGMSEHLQIYKSYIHESDMKLMRENSKEIYGGL